MSFSQFSWQNDYDSVRRDSFVEMILRKIAVNKKRRMDSNSKSYTIRFHRVSLWNISYLITIFI